MKTHLLIALRITAITLVLFGVLYPLLVAGIAHLITPHGGEGETIQVSGQIVGFKHIGQSFTSDMYFHGRPSAVNYNAAATGGSNKAIANPDYLTQVRERVANLRSANPETAAQEIPVDLVTASGGGLDPHISVEAALFQAPRIAKARGLDVAAIEALIQLHTEGPLAGLFGPRYVHVLQLNIALDQQK
jgi:K+-transporting ATPase ATPase C chain